MWFGKDVFYHHYSIFSCKAFVHVPKNERSKLDAKICQFIFLGYGQDEFGYRLYDPVENKLVKSRDMVFYEDQTIKNIEKVEKTLTRSDSARDLDIVSLMPLPDPNQTNINDVVQNGYQHQDETIGHRG